MPRVKCYTVGMLLVQIPSLNSYSGEFSVCVCSQVEIMVAFRVRVWPPGGVGAGTEQ